LRSAGAADLGGLGATYSHDVTLSIRHDTTDRSSFMPGVLMAVKAIGSSTGVTVGLDKLLGI